MGPNPLEMLDEKKLKEEQDQRMSEADRLRRIGNVVNTLTSGTSFGEAFLGRKNAPVEGGKSYLAAADDQKTFADRAQKTIDDLRQHGLKEQDLTRDRSYQEGIRTQENERQDRIRADQNKRDDLRHSEDQKFQRGRDDQNHTQALELANVKEGWDRTEKQKAVDDKKKLAITEVEDRRRNIEDNVARVRKMIDKEGGTNEFFGPHNDILNATVEEIATDMAKLSDPGSVARPAEVEQWKKGLVESGVFQRDSTAIAKLDEFKKRVTDRVANAYKVRGLQDPGSGQGQVAQGDPGALKAPVTPKAPTTPDEDKQAIAWAQANPGDPFALEILKDHGISPKTTMAR